MNIRCINCLNEFDVEELDGRVNCSSCGFELNVEEAELIATLPIEFLPQIQKKVKNKDATDDYNLIYQIAGLLSSIDRSPKTFLELSVKKNNINAIYDLGCFHHDLARINARNESRMNTSDNLAFKLLKQAVELGHPSAKRKMLVYAKYAVNNAVETIKGWSIEGTKTIELDEIISLDSHLEVLRNFKDVRIIHTNIYDLAYYFHSKRSSYRVKTLIVNIDVNKVDGVIFDSIDTLVYLGDKAFPSLPAFKETAVGQVIFINSGFLNGGKYLYEGCKYIINHFDTFNDKENFITTLSKNTDKFKKLTKELIIKDDNLKSTNFLISNNIVKYDVLLECLKEDIIEEKKMLIVDAINNVSNNEKDVYNKKVERKETLDLGLDGYTLKDFKIEFSCTKKEDKIFISKYLGKEAVVFVPANVDGFTKFEIESFGKNDSITSIIFEEGITSITAKESKLGVFHYLKNLKEITLPSSLKDIDMDMFNTLNSDINIKVSNESDLLKFNEDVIAFKDTLLYINNRKTLTNLVIPKYITNIPNLNLMQSSVLTINIHNEVKSLGVINCRECTNLTNIKLPDCLTILNESAFEDCYNLKEVKLPSNLVTIEANCFKSCWSLEKADLPSKLETIGERAFYVCKSLAEVNFPSKIKYIGPSAFGWCTSLKTIEIPKTIDIINRSTFKGCKNLGDLIIPSNIKHICRKAFYECIRITSITIEEGVERIDEAAFEECRKLKTLNIPKSVKEIPTPICMSCSKLVVTIDEGANTSKWTKDWNDISKASRPYSW